MSCFRTLFACLAAVALFGLAASAGAITIDFETEDDFSTALVDGQDISTPPEFGNLIAISTPAGELASNLHNGPAIFDSNGAGGPDPDLQVGLGNILILQCDSSNGGCANDTQTVSGIFDEPNDQRDGGTIEIDFLQTVEIGRSRWWTSTAEQTPTSCSRTCSARRGPSRCPRSGRST